MVPVALGSCVSLIALLLLSSSNCWSLAAAEPESYLKQFGTYSALADRIAALLGAEEPLQAEDVVKLTAEVRRVCTSGNPSSARYHLAVSDLLSAYGQGETGVLDQRAVEQVCSAIMACQLDDSCTLATSQAPHDGPSTGVVHGELRLAAALFLFVEGLLGVYIPVWLKSVEGYEWWLSLLNCFSGGVFLAAGLVHLLPHCAESQARLGPSIGDYPLYLVLITLGYMLVLFVERVLFDVHGSEHGHGPHTGIAPPCVDCRTAEEAMGPSSSSGDLAGEMGGNTDGSNGVLTATGAAPLTPSHASTRYNLRSRGAVSSTPASETATGALRKPLLADERAGTVADDAGRQAAQPSPCGHIHSHGASDATPEHHDRHSIHDHVLYAHGHGPAAPTHHHAVMSGDLRQGVILLVAMVIHTFLECMALGLMDVRKEFLMLFMAIASHKLISGLALSSRFLKDGATAKQITMYVGPFTLVAPTAITVGMFVKDVNPLVHLALSCFATGTFLYVGASEIVEEEFEGDMRSGRTDISQVFARWCKFFMLLLGVASIALLSLIPDAHDHSHMGHGHGLTGGLHAQGVHHHHHHHH